MLKTLFLLVSLTAACTARSPPYDPYSCQNRCGESSPLAKYGCLCGSVCKEYPDLHPTCCRDYSKYCRPSSNGCAAPGKVAYATVVSSARRWYREGSVIKYRCDRGYFIDHEERTCLRGVWTDAPRCRRPVFAFCYPPSTGSLIWYEPVANAYKVTDSITYGCPPGYQLDGHKLRTCVGNQLWDYDPPTCKRVTCPYREVPENGYYEPVSSGPYYPGYTQTYYCEVGYYMSGPSSAKCQRDGKWNKPPPLCYRVQCPPPTPPVNGYKKPGSKVVWYYNNEVTFGCDDGFVLSGPETLSCQSNGKWDKDFPQCHYRSCKGRCWYEYVETEPCQCIPDCDKTLYTCCPDADVCPVKDDPHCEAPEAPEYGSVTTHASYPPGVEVWYSCRKGYKLIGSKKTTCIGPDWRNPAPKCRRVTGPPRSCRGRCGKAGKSCDCTTDCIDYGSCCDDYQHQCN